MRRDWRLKGADVWGKSCPEGGAELLGVLIVQDAGVYEGWLCNDTDAREVMDELNAGEIPSFQRYHWHPIDGSRFELEVATRKFMGRYFKNLESQGYFQWYTGEWSWRAAELAPELAIAEGGDRYADLDDDSFAARRRRSQGRRRLEEAEREAIEASQSSTAMDMLTWDPGAKRKLPPTNQLPVLRPGATLLYKRESSWQVKFWMGWVDHNWKYVDGERVKFYGVFAQWQKNGAPRLLGRHENHQDALLDLRQRIGAKRKAGYEEL